MGASAGRRNCWRALRTPVIIPLTASSRGESSMMRVSRTASAVSSSPRPMSSPRPGAKRGTSRGASASATRQSAAVAASTMVSALLASAQAASGPARRWMRANTGMKALPSVAPASSWKIRSGTRKATQ